MIKNLFLFFAASVIFVACTTNAITGRKQLSLISESWSRADNRFQINSYEMFFLVRDIPV